MELLTSIREMQSHAGGLERQGRRIGLVPTMGYLHEGHLSLVRALRGRCDSLWLSSFVNPAQFGPAEDLERYPRDLERDLALCREAGVDGVLAPAAAEVYPPGFSTWVTPGPVADRYCGATRPGHFRGVLSIVLRLFLWTRCRVAAFGAKDAQQLWLIRRMIRDLDLEVEVVEGATLREADGLAMSSRNVHLGPEDRRSALAISRALRLGRDALAAGAGAGHALDLMRAELDREAALTLDYLHVADWSTLGSLAGVPERPQWREAPDGGGERELVLLAAARVGAVRLIDNMRVTTKHGD
ncbi:MAG: pantoate--beta-alanine ligase [bacterium]|nr:pantoate--beta-alanine ligase [bacterium]